MTFSSRTLQTVLLGVLAFTLLCACGTTQLLQPVPASKENLAKVYFLRKSFTPGMQDFRLAINDITVATLADNDYVAVYVPVRENNFVYFDARHGPPFFFTLPIKGTHSIFVVISGDATSRGITYEGTQRYITTSYDRRAYEVTRTEAEVIVAAFGKKLE